MHQHSSLLPHCEPLVRASPCVEFCNCSVSTETELGQLPFLQTRVSKIDEKWKERWLETTS